MRRRKATKNLSSDSSDDEPLSRKVSKQKPTDSSSESDIENYLQPADKIDLNSSFFDLQKGDPPQSFNEIEDNILAGVTKLSDSSSDEPADKPEPSTSKLNFKQLHDYTKKMEETKRHVEMYNAKKQAEHDQIDIFNLLAAGESKLSEEKQAALADLHSSDFESCSDSEKDTWEEVADAKDKSVVPKEGLQITVELPGVMKKKKGVDLLAAMKRRFNRIKKEHQLLIHQVHLLCWIAHGNHVSTMINSQSVLAVALSLLPSQQCYPANRTDLSYLEQILKWFRSAVVNVERAVPPDKPLDEMLEAQITKKEAYDKKMLVYIFVAILRSLGIQCRLVLSFQVLPLRPPSSELCSLSTKSDDKAKKQAKEEVELSTLKSRSKSASGVKDEPSKLKVEEGKKARSKSAGEAKKTEPSKLKGEAKKTESSKGQAAKKARSKGAAEAKKSEPSKLNIEDLRRGRSKSGSDVKETRSKDADEAKKKEPSKKAKKIEPSSKTQVQTGSEGRKGRSKKTDEAKGEASKLKVVEDSKTRSKSANDANENGVSQSKAANTRSKSSSNVAAKAKPKPKAIIKIKLPTRSKAKEKVIPQLDGVNDSASEDEVLSQLDTEASTSKPNLRKLKQKQAPCPIKTHPKRLKTKPTKYKDSDSDDDDFTRSPFSKKNKDSPVATNSAPNLKKLKSLRSKTLDVRKDIIDLVKGRISENKQTTKKRKSAKADSDGSDYAPEEIKKKHHDSDDEFVPKIKVKKRVQVKQSSDDENKTKKKQGVDVWAEVFLETEEKWISVDVVKGQVHCVSELYTRATHPVSYVVAWNNDNSLKDITRRYCQNFNTVTRKLRVNQKWWLASLKAFVGPKTARDREEDDELERQQLEKPLPTSIAEYKNHPLYVLKRHLLKFEALYPADAPTLGFVRKEPVYSRQCVYTLHSRDIWLKHAKVVKLGEKPYKIVKARPRWDKLSNSIITDQLLEIFGPWQTEDYVPPTAENGVVPRNAFGNVELFKPCMLPKKTVHLKLPGLNKLARRMNIDCASVIVGFDFHGGWNHPTYDGFVVCEEYADILVAAWELEQDELEKKEREKVDKRVYGNWKRLIKGLLIRERLKKKYDFGETSQGGGKGKKKGAPKFATKKRKIESDSE